MRAAITSSPINMLICIAWRCWLLQLLFYLARHPQLL
jgi:hypothetical protein